MWSNVPLAVRFRQDLALQQRSIHTDCGTGILLAAHTNLTWFPLLRRTVGVRDGSKAAVAAELAAGPVFQIAADLLQCPSRQPWATTGQSLGQDTEGSNPIWRSMHCRCR